MAKITSNPEGRAARANRDSTLRSRRRELRAIYTGQILAALAGNTRNNELSINEEIHLAIDYADNAAKLIAQMEDVEIYDAP